MNGGIESVATRIGINGFGRIGRQVLRATLERYPGRLEVVAVNKRSGSPAENARLFKYDSTYGRYPGIVEPTEDGITIDGSEVRILKEPEPSRDPMGESSAWRSSWSPPGSSRTRESRVDISKRVRVR